MGPPFEQSFDDDVGINALRYRADILGTETVPLSFSLLFFWGGEGGGGAMFKAVRGSNEDAVPMVVLPDCDLRKDCGGAARRP